MPNALITVPYTSSGLTTGEALAPAALRAAGLLEALRGADRDVADYGDVQFTPQRPQRDSHTAIIAPETFAEMVHAVRAATSRALAAGRFPFVVGGECPLLLGCLAAARDTYQRIGLLFVDGHEDAWPPSASETGEAADMELGLALGATQLAGLEEIAGLLPVIRAADTFLLGPRDRGEIEAAGVMSLAGSLPFLSDAKLCEGDASTLGRTWAGRLHTTAGRWWFHLDLDVLSSAALAAVRYPQPGGLSWDTLQRLTIAALGVPGLVGLNLTIYNPDLDPTGLGAQRIVQFISMIAPQLTSSRA